jgi:hypothetical protein
MTAETMSGMPGPSSDTAAAERHERGGGGGTGEANSSTTRTLRDVMQEPSTSVPDVVVLDSLSEPEEPEPKDVLDPKQDLWLSTADG